MSQNGKGDKPRNCFSKAFRDNHEAIDWSKGRKPAPPRKVSADEMLLGDFLKPPECLIPTLADLLKGDKK